mmetsp:Transcript_89608/g.155128  ORF Transcript_89608/g.155128 Transcript_89608/m.155128 type:complete len:220 (+) Transcript_89608:3064-3723(+)
MAASAQTTPLHPAALRSVASGTHATRPVLCTWHQRDAAAPGRPPAAPHLGIQISPPTWPRSPQRCSPRHRHRCPGLPARPPPREVTRPPCSRPLPSAASAARAWRSAAGPPPAAAAHPPQRPRTRPHCAPSGTWAAHPSTARSVPVRTRRRTVLAARTAFAQVWCGPPRMLGPRASAPGSTAHPGADADRGRTRPGSVQTQRAACRAPAPSRRTATPAP